MFIHRLLPFLLFITCTSSVFAQEDPMAPDDDLSALLDDTSVSEEEPQINPSDADVPVDGSDDEIQEIAEAPEDGLRVGLSVGSLYGLSLQIPLEDNAFKTQLGWYPGGIGGYSTLIFGDGNNEESRLHFGVGLNYALGIDGLGDDINIWALGLIDPYSDSTFSAAVHVDIGVDLPLSDTLSLTADIYPGLIVFPTIALQWPVQVGLDMRF